MIITKQVVADKIAAYLHHEISLEQLVDWAECGMMDGEIDAHEAGAIASALTRLGVSDVRAFGLTWQDCEELLQQLGYRARVEIVATGQEP